MNNNDVGLKLKNYAFLGFVLIFLTISNSCSNDDTAITQEDISETEEENPIDEEEVEEEVEEEPNDDSIGEVEFFNSDVVEDSYILVNDAGNNDVYLMDKNAELVHQWPLVNNIGNDAFLMPNGMLLAILEVNTPLITFGGKGGKIQLIEADGTINWSFDYSSEEYIAHHDVEMLPNGNILIMVWERKTAQEVEEAGSSLTIDVFPETIIEVNPSTDEIVWEWHAWDHLIQDFDDTKANFGTVADNPQLINLNYSNNDDGDIMHGNGIAYDADSDLIYLSINFYHEVWVIDHSTTTAEATSNSGGTYNKGGDLVYRFGNPSAYDNTTGERLFFNNHFPNFIKDGRDGAGNMLIFVNNMNGNAQSVIYELQFPANLDLQPGLDNEPTVVWSFTDEDLYSPKVSGAVRLTNGNTLITQGTAGFWEVTPEEKIAWRFNGDGFYWRGYDYAKTAPEILSLGL